MQKVSDNVALITGGGRGIGRAIALRFARSGARIVIASRSQAELEETRRLVESHGAECHARVTDVASLDDITGLIADTLEHFGRLDILVNNAGVAAQAPIENMDTSLFHMLYTINIAATFHTCRAAWAHLKKQGGVIVNISSMAAQDPFPGLAVYGASKAWVNAWTKGLAEEGRTSGIRVFAVAPGAVETRMLRDAFPDFPRDQTLKPDDIADVVFALTRPECRHATGQVVYVKK